MKKKLIKKSLALLLSVLMVAMALPFAVLADEVAVAEEKWETLESGTSKLLVDGGNYKLSEAYSGMALTLSGNGDFVIDLNGKELKVNTIKGRNSGKLTIIDSVGGGSLVVEKVTVVGSEFELHIGDVSVVGGLTVNTETEFKFIPVYFDGTKAIEYPVTINYADAAEKSIVSANLAQFTSPELAAAAKSFVTVGGTKMSGDAEYRVIGSALTVGTNKALLSYATLTLKGSIGLNLYFDLNGCTGETAVNTLYYSIGGADAVAVPVTDDLKDLGRHKFTILVNPADIAEDITLWFDAKEKGTWSYSVAEYAEHLYSQSTDAAAQALAVAMVNFGNEIAKLNGESVEVAFEGLSESYGAWLTDKLSNSEYVDVSEHHHYDNADESGIHFDRMSLVVGDTVTIRIYLNENYESFDKDNYKYYFSTTEIDSDGTEYTTVSAEIELKEGENGEAYVEIKNIPSGDFHKLFTVSVKNSNTVMFAFTINIYSYAKILEGENAGLANAIYWYGVASANFFKTNV